VNMRINISNKFTAAELNSVYRILLDFKLGRISRFAVNNNR